MRNKEKTKVLISGTIFRSFAHHIYESGNKCMAENIHAEEIVYVNGDLIEEFFTFVHPQITAPYKLITHNSQHVIGTDNLIYIDNKIIRWFGQNVSVHHPKITPIPTGLPHDTSCGPRKLSHVASCENKFVIVHENNVPDSPLIWEAVLLGAVTVMKKNFLGEYFQKIGLPILMIENLDEFATTSEEKKAKIYSDIMARCISIKDNLLSPAYWRGVVTAPEHTRDEAVVVFAIGKKFQNLYARTYMPSHIRLCQDICRPLIIVGDYIQKVPGKSPQWQREIMFRAPIFSNINRVMMLDADILTKNTQENPFDLVPQSEWGLVKNNTFDLPTLAESDLCLYKYCPAEKRPDFVLNFGFFIVNKKIHRDIMEYVFENYEEQPLDVQGPLSYYFINDYKGTILPFRFNTVVGSYLEKYGYSMTTVMSLWRESHFLHFAGNVNKKILRLFLIFEKYPFLSRLFAHPAFLWCADRMTFIIKTIKRI